MGKKVLILSGSPRRGGNSDMLCDEFLRGAADAGNEVKKIFVRDERIEYCNACYACRETGECVIKDGMAGVLSAMHWADVIVMTSPVYFYSIDAQMKAVIDRTLAQWTKIENKEFYYIMTAADEEPEAMDTTLACFRGLAVCLKGSKERGVLYGNGLYEAGAVKGTAYMQEAYEMGKNV
ncbi:MAG: flavodoxin family protein [Clostridia bacterium]|nr:flavodoxin family protein [Clostridia bacterium]